MWVNVMSTVFNTRPQNIILVWSVKSLTGLTAAVWSLEFLGRWWHVLPGCSAHVCEMSQQLQCNDLSPTQLLSAHHVYAFPRKSTLIHLLSLACKVQINFKICMHFGCNFSRPNIHQSDKSSSSRSLEICGSVGRLQPVGSVEQSAPLRAGFLKATTA